MSPDDQHLDHQLDQHVDDETLTLLALGEDAGTAVEQEHVAVCARCSDEVAALSEVALAARTSAPLVAPPAHVWESVADELALADRTLPELPGAGDEDASPHPGAPAAVVPLRPPRRRAWTWVAAAAAVGVVVGGVGTWAAVRQPAWDVVASAVLEPLPGWDALGEALVETDSSGRRVLVVDLADDVPAGGFREVWLLRPDVSGLVSVGTLDGTSGRFDLPEGLDLAEFSVVDVSQEVFDGDPAHSGDSIVRGPLRS
ncbi:anti-sigma factor [Cellulomonas sp. DKR-3]|uniref:Anti-sigma factor n=1 Tax=Cellulomonas fulva TaxID=2835530 RepID=A0ABS5TWP3_9CELL|nr:anti-sigma factor [Cellulomonas fulva]MBT0993566.1 anti-sigma factor [Cellulomonas fulva]